MDKNTENYVVIEAILNKEILWQLSLDSKYKFYLTTRIYIS